MSKIDTSELQRIITGRVVPHIYSFLTNTLPNYLKVGDTYRPVEERLNEWRKHYIDLEEVSRHKASINDNVFFRDYAVHKYLQQKGIAQIPIDASKNIHSNEFFEGAEGSDVSEAVDEIVRNYQNTDSYDYYTNLKELVEFHYKRNQDFEPRQNQQQVLDAFSAAIKKGRRNLLMYAVMRFGKSITAIWAAKNINAQLTVVVSAKADVLSEWKQTVESHKDFSGYRFLDRRDLKKGMKWSDFYKKTFTTGGGDKEVCTNIVLFLTLQDLAGSSEVIKNHHKILQRSKIDLLIIDETHFGARASVLGKILAGVEIEEVDKDFLKKNKEDPEDLSSLDKLEAIKANITLHLSGTPYRILMGSEFTEEDIIAFVQFSDIYKAKLDWSAEHLDQDEWVNPYYGFPQMIRFAFNPNESSRRRLAEIPGSKPSELFTPANIKKGSGSKKFLHEEEVTDLLKVLDGSKNDTNMLGLLDNETVKAGKLARHVVLVLPYRASCDALEELIKKNKSSFKNINKYTIFNISGHNQKLSKPEAIKAAIKRAESAGKQTITLTVNRMLTGSTVPYWDTMIYLKGTASPQEYDQAIFRLQSPWVETYQNDNGKIVKYDMKPQTLLVDLDPTRLFYLQELKAFTYGANTQKIGNENIEAFIERELRISPIITLNTESNKLIEVTPTNIIDQARKYANDRTITEDVQEIGIDASLKNNPAIFEFINKLAELGGKNGLNIRPNQDEGEELDGMAPEEEVTGAESTQTSIAEHDTDITEDISSFEKRFRTYYVMIILFAFLSNTEEKSLTDVIENIEANEDNRRIARNLGLQKSHLKLICEEINPYVRSALDYKIQNADFRSYDETITPIEHIEIAIHKFARLSEAEVFTPSPIVNKIYDAFEESFWRGAREVKVLDIASKSGSFAKGFFEKAAQHGIEIEHIKNNFYSIPTSLVAYEFTRKMYQALGLNVDNIARHFNSFDLLKLDHGSVRYLLSQDKKFCEISLNDLKSYTEEETRKNMKFTAIVGNPPYQEQTKDTSDNPIYHHFIEEAYKLSDKVSLIHPGRFLFNAGKTPKIWNEKMLNDTHLKVVLYESKSSNIFPNTNIPGGIAITYRDTSKNYGALEVFTSFPELRSVLNKATNKVDFSEVTEIIYSQNKFKLDVLYHDYPKYKKIIGSAGQEKRLTTSIFEQLGVFSETKLKTSDYKILGLISNKRVFKYIHEKYIEKHENISSFKVILPKSNGSGALGVVVPTSLIGEPALGEPNVGYTQSFIGFGSFKTKAEALNCMNFLKTKFCRALLGTLKVTQDNSKKVWKNVPLQDFTNKSDIDWSKSISEINKQLYKKYDLNKEEIEFIEIHVKPMS